ncbi:MAG TPA: DUF1800 domain-containing protein [Pyrinomonadaceae bacterium]|nr:DUF1800 domain-containing protein [Pyrinomonadaceae bacterium]
MSSFRSISKGFIASIATVLSTVLLVCVSISAQMPEDAPILISDAESTAAYATVNGVSVKAVRPSRDEVVTVYLTNLDLLEDEGATAFRAEFQDSRYYRYPLQIVGFERTQERKNVYALAIRVAGLPEIGEVLVRVTWRGMTSNRTRLMIGEKGPRIADDEGAFPTPMPGTQTLTKTRAANRAALPWAGDRVRFMTQATFGVNAATELKVRRLGYNTWLEQQMDEQRYLQFTYPEFPLQPQVPIPTCDGDTQPTDVPITCFRDRYTMYPLQNWFYKEALYNEDQQLRRRVSWSLHQIFVVSGRQLNQPSRMLPYIQILDKNAFGNYRTLLEEMTLSPAMGNYLDMASSTVQNPNENYAREILQLFSIGLDQLNQDGTPILDGNGNKIPTYNQETIVNFAKIFTGWTYCNVGCGNSQPGIVNYRDSMVLTPANHDTTTKTLLNYPGATPFVPAGQDPNVDLDAALDNIFYHPTTAPFISKLLIKQLVTSNPTPAYVGRISAVFRNNGSGVRGDLKAVVKAILLDPEARGNVKTDPNYGHLREPVLFLTSFMRPFSPVAANNITVPVACNGLSDGVLNGLSQPLDQDVWNPPTVFSYYPMEYIIPNTPLAGPEFQIFSTGTALKRPNAVNQMAPAGSTTSGGVAAVTGTASNTPCGTRIQFTRLQDLAAADSTGGQLVDTLNRELLNGSMSAAYRQQVLNAVQAVSAADTLKRARTALYIIATSSQYQVQR